MPVFEMGLNDFSLRESCIVLFALDVMCMSFTHVMHETQSAFFFFKLCGILLPGYNMILFAVLLSMDVRIVSRVLT